MKKILVINTISYVVGGMSTVIMNYFEKINPQNYNMEFVINDDIDLRYLNLLDSRNAKYYYITRKKNPLNYFFELRKLIQKNKYDIVHIHGNSCTASIETMAAKLGECKNIIVHSHNSTCLHPILHKILRPFFEFSCNKRIACSEIAGKWMFRKKPFTIIENALELKKYIFNSAKRNEYRLKMNVSKNEIVIGHVGFFNEQKNHKLLIDIARYLIIEKKENVRLMLVGEGEFLEMIKDYCKQYNIEDRVCFWGTTADISGVMSAMDVFVFPSNWEGLGIVLIEAQLMGLPSIASTAVPSITKITDECKYIDLSADISEWANSVIDLGKKSLENKNHSLTLKNLERYDIDVQIAKLESFYDSCD